MCSLRADVAIKAFTCAKNFCLFVWCSGRQLAELDYEVLQGFNHLYPNRPKIPETCSLLILFVSRLYRLMLTLEIGKGMLAV